MEIDAKSREKFLEYRSNWNKFAYEILGVRLDSSQRDVLRSVQNNRRTTVKSGHARGKDYVAAVASLCFLYLNVPSKVVLTAPTGRQVEKIMMAELASIYSAANRKLKQYNWYLGGVVQTSGVIFRELPDWYLIGFKAEDKATEAWTGFHSKNILICVTEASGIEDETFQAIEGILPGELSRLLLVGNPNRKNGEFFNSFRTGNYNKFTLNCMEAPNVINKNHNIPGQVDYEWIDDHVRKPGWCTVIDERNKDPLKYNDFEWCDVWYRPSDPFLVKVLGEFPRQTTDSLVPLHWIDLAVKRWEDQHSKYMRFVDSVKSGYLEPEPHFYTITQDDGGNKIPYQIGVDVAGMGVDTTVYVHKIGDYVGHTEVFSQQDHMHTVGDIVLRVKSVLKITNCQIFIDSIGEGAGVYSRLKEVIDEGVFNDFNYNVTLFSVKYSESARFNKDKTGTRQFANMRAYCYWAVRDALDPALDGKLCLPPDEEMHFEITELLYKIRSDGRIIIQPKKEFKEKVGRSPDKGDTLSIVHYPKLGLDHVIEENTLSGLGVFS